MVVLSCPVEPLACSVSLSLWYCWFSPMLLLGMFDLRCPSLEICLFCLALFSLLLVRSLSVCGIAG